MNLVFDLDYDHGLAGQELRSLIGAKAANLALMTSELRLPVPPGFVISTAACRAFLADGWPAGLDDELRAHMQRLEERTARRFGDPSAPLLLSVRSGAPVSMPGMMDTILNLGLNNETAAGLAHATGNAEFARDCEDRLALMFGALVGSKPPADVWQQLRAAIAVIFRSWNSERAQAYRRLEQISDHLGSSVTVQAMVFGNSGPDSATGVLFSRNPATGDRVPYGDVLFDAQGEDVVSGARRTFPLAVLDERMPGVSRLLRQHADRLERHFADMCDVEFTIEDGQLWLLQARIGKRSPQAGLRIAVDMAEDPGFPLSREEAVRRVAAIVADPPRLAVGRSGDVEPIASGLPASPGLATGEIVTSVSAARDASDASRPFILVRSETSPDDVPVMARAAGLLTAHGGVACHAAVVARGWGVPAVVSVVGLHVGEGEIKLGGRRYPAGTTISIDGSTGDVYAVAVPGDRVPMPEAAKLLSWASQAGIDLAAARGAEPGPSRGEQAQAGPAAVVRGDDVIGCLSIKGMASPEMLAGALLTTGAALQPVLDELADAGMITITAGMARLTEAGSARAAALTEALARQWGQRQAAAALDAFVPLDKRVKAAVTAWQVRGAGGEQALNDHTDAGYDAAVLADLQVIHAEVSGWLSSAAEPSGRLSGYGSRLNRAAAAAAYGDHRFISSPRVDSYHGIWFELHEELIRLAGRTRPDEVAAGRA